MTSQTDLPDLNVWLAMTSTGHAHHTQAVDYWESEAAERVLSNLLPSCNASAPNRGCPMAEHEQSAWDLFHALVCDLPLPSKHCTDSYPAALAMANGWQLAAPFMSHRPTRSGQ